MSQSAAASTLGATSPTCAGEFHLTSDDGLEGWCWYPDQPEERAAVELLVDGKVVRAARATRFLQNRRDLGTGDGYCGFWFPLPSEIGREGVRTILEVRERRSQQIFGRVVFGSNDRAQHLRLDAVEAALTAAGDTLQQLPRTPAFSSQLQELSQILLHLATRPHDRAQPQTPGLAACLERIAFVPASDLGWSPAPHVSVIVPSPASDVAGLAATLRDASRALAGLGAELILLDDGALPMAALLPTRLRHLQLVRTPPASRPGAAPGSALNAAAAVARGAFLAVTQPGGPSPAGLREAAADAAQGTLGLEAAGSDPEHADFRRHRLCCLVSREDLFAMGGFDPVLREEAMWSDLAAKAEALGMQVRRWTAPSPQRLLQPQAAHHV